MGNIIIPFKSRSEAMRLASALRVEGIGANVVNTPSIYGKSCGLSVVTSEAYRSRTVYIIKVLGLNSVIGIFVR